jgi:hypothetical protein
LSSVSWGRLYLDEPPEPPAPEDPEPDDPDPDDPPLMPPEEPELPPDDPPPMLPEEPELPEPEVSELPEPDEPELPEPDEPELPGAQSALDEPLLEPDVPGGHGVELELPELPLLPDEPEEPESIELPLLPLLPDEPESIELPPEEPVLPLPVPVDDDWATAKPAAAKSATSNAEDDLRILPPKNEHSKGTADCYRQQNLCQYFRMSSLRAALQTYSDFASVCRKNPATTLQHSCNSVRRGQPLTSPLASAAR